MQSPLTISNIKLDNCECADRETDMRLTLVQLPAHSQTASPMESPQVIIDEGQRTVRRLTRTGHNTDAFDVSATGTTITGCTVLNQDDCLAINKGSNIVFTGNSCTGGHGVSIGSIKTGANVENVTITCGRAASSVGRTLIAVAGTTRSSTTRTASVSRCVDSTSCCGRVG